MYKQSWKLLGRGQDADFTVAYINARIIDPESKLDIIGSLLTKGDKIVDFGQDLFNNGIPSTIDEVVDCNNNILMPGLIDIHVHFREPGQEHKETIHTGSKSAAAGGVTTVVCQPNTIPTISSIITAKYIKMRALESAYVNIEFYASITKPDNSLSDMALLKEAGAVGFTDDGMPVMNSLTMRQALSYSSMLDTVVAQHAEDLNLSNNGHINEGTVSYELGLKGIPDISESIIVNRDIALMKNIKNVHYHILHVSSQDSLNIIKQAKNQGLKVTCEVTPHHLTLTEQDVITHGTLAKINPPLRTENDRLSMVEGLKNGIIDCIATDHAPHEVNTKELPLDTAAFGIVGLETMLPISLELYHNGTISLIDLLATLTYKPANIIKVPRGRIKKGFVADLIILDLNHEWTIDILKFASKSKNSPFHNRKVKGKVLRTIVSGKTTYTAVRNI
ncbi:dihydroorotase [Ehrlichia canis]|uniref:Dihydroorotase n=1 Tax=Ehrlichia canis (strain Jake) TaxID=269484 RepID=PYRC_EHRCJ|nr:dihydroorotase [Ehrlichia canis]Q3YRI2.1 RecName: Full=Dihydroorotase; Short=DHOase [Ehrlichia canis str. Jake]AAZ68673.1 dihydroorotase [Ehrlichia canis str. Jake]AUO54596.1 dihydroorotase [Ehrlichia canis]UKC53145.1 dihydroorotase [Ehrlichia canis]UKC54082.1 dihydroorotase [Ehrlichia canis]UKC55018.1 dihydroorotase [Ehrlichia canis]